MSNGIHDRFLTWNLHKFAAICSKCVLAIRGKEASWIGFLGWSQWFVDSKTHPVITAGSMPSITLLLSNSFPHLSFDPKEFKLHQIASNCYIERCWNMLKRWAAQVFPLRGKLLNVRELNQKSLAENKEALRFGQITSLWISVTNNSCHSQTAWFRRPWISWKFSACLLTRRRLQTCDMERHKIASVLQHLSLSTVFLCFSIVLTLPNFFPHALHFVDIFAFGCGLFREGHDHGRPRLRRFPHQRSSHQFLPLLLAGPVPERKHALKWQVASSWPRLCSAIFITWRPFCPADICAKAQRKTKLPAAVHYPDCEGNERRPGKTILHDGWIREVEEKVKGWCGMEDQVLQRSWH